MRSCCPSWHADAYDDVEMSNGCSGVSAYESEFPCVHLKYMAAWCNFIRLCQKLKQLVDKQSQNQRLCIGEMPNLVFTPSEA